jgi:hypothetical protein
VLRPVLVLLSIAGIALTVICYFHGHGRIIAHYPNSLEFDPPNLWYHTYTYNGDVHFQLAWTFLAPAVYIALYTAPAATEGTRTLVVVFALYILLASPLLSSTSSTGVSPIVPYLVLLSSVTAIVMGRTIPSALQRRRDLHRAASLARGLCPTCGYDLRATPTHCPECGFQTALPDAPTPPPRTQPQSRLGEG